MDTLGTRAAIALRIKQLRAEHGITQERFALMVDLNRSYLAGIEKGNRNFGIDTLDKVVRGFNLTYREFFERMQQSPYPQPIDLTQQPRPTLYQSSSQ